MQFIIKKYLQQNNIKKISYNINQLNSDLAKFVFEQNAYFSSLKKNFKLSSKLLNLKFSSLKKKILNLVVLNTLILSNKKFSNNYLFENFLYLYYFSLFYRYLNSVLLDKYKNNYFYILSNKTEFKNFVNIPYNYIWYNKLINGLTFKQLIVSWSLYHFIYTNGLSFSYYNYFKINSIYFEIMQITNSYFDSVNLFFFFFLKKFFFDFKKKIFFFKNFKFFNLLTNSNLLLLNYYISLNYYINIDLPILLKYDYFSKNSSIFNYLFFKFIFYSNKFIFSFLKSSVLINYEIFLLKKTFLVFEPKKIFITQISLFLSLIKNNINYFNNKILIRHFKDIPYDSIFYLKQHYYEYMILLNDILLNDFDWTLENAGSWSIIQIWIDELIKHILKLWKENKPDDNAQYSPNFHHLHELALTFLWGEEISILEWIKTLANLRFFGSYDRPVFTNIVNFKQLSIITSIVFHKPKFYSHVSKSFQKVFYVKYNFTWNQLLEIINVNLTTSLLAYRNHYKTNFYQLLQYAPMSNINENNWAIILYLFIYLCIFWKIKYHYYWHYFGWSKIWTPTLFWSFFSKNYFIWNNLSNIIWKMYESHNQITEKKFFDLLLLNTFFYNFLFKFFFLTKKKLWTTTWTNFFYNQLWLNIFWSFKSFMLPSKNSYFDINLFYSINNVSYFYPQNFFFSNLILLFENNFFLYSDIFFSDFFFDWKIFLENLNSEVFLTNSNIRNNNSKKCVSKSIFFKKKNLNIFYSKYFLVIENILNETFLNFFSELVYDCYTNFWSHVSFTEFHANETNFLEQSNFISNVFSSSFNYWFFSWFNQVYLYNSKSFNKKIIIFLLKFFMFFEKWLIEQLKHFWNLFIEFFFIKLKSYKLIINEDLLLIYFNFCLTTFLNKLISSKNYLFQFNETIIIWMIYWIFIQFHNNSWDTQFWKFLFSDFYMWEFYPNIKLFFNWCLFMIIKELLELWD